MFTQLNSSIKKHQERIVLGGIEVKRDIGSSMGPFSYSQEYRVVYPQMVIDSLSDLYREYNEVFVKLVQANRESAQDYQYTANGPDRSPANFAVQIDMLGLPDKFLSAASGLEKAAVTKLLRSSIFEIENSLAMYQLLQRIFESRSNPTRFNEQFRETLRELSELHQKPIALLAVTDAKYVSMKSSEFGKDESEPLSDEEVKVLSGFDAFFSPSQFRKHVESTGGSCEYLLYVRSSDPIDKLKDPRVKVDHPLLSDESMRSVIKRHAITLNIDTPGSEYGRRINDSKAYMPEMGMAVQIAEEFDLYTDAFAQHRKSGKDYQSFQDGQRLAPALASYLSRCGVDPIDVERGIVLLRAKPMLGAYGCYGHKVLNLTSRQHREWLRTNLKRRGSYVIQPEMITPQVVSEHGISYAYIDRVFFSRVGAGSPRFIGGFRLLMPCDSSEAGNGRIHGSSDAVSVEITS